MSDSVIHSEEESFHPAYYVMTVAGAIMFVSFPWFFPKGDVDMRPWLALFGVFWLLFCLNMFWLRVVVYPDRVSARLGRIVPMWRTTVRIDEIESIEVVDLGWWRWNGGAHLTRYKRKSALTILTGGPRAVCIDRNHGRRVVISSVRPEVLVEAIEQVRREARG